jgi:molecular chaperone DnaJ
MAEKDLYSILGVSKSAKTDEIKRAYRKLARKYHPDVNPGDKDAEEKFKEVSAAFDVLGDEEKRKLYDEFGMDGLRGGFDPDQARAYTRWSEQSRRTGGFGGFRDMGDFADLGSVFGDLFGGQFRERRAGARRGSDAEAEVTIDFLTAIRGGEINLRYENPVPCSRCGGSGQEGVGGQSCSVCGGSGRQRVGQGPIDMSIPCQHCHGTGREPGPPCHVCRGSGTVRTESNLKVKIPAGIDDGERMRLAGKGNPGENNGQPGDLYLRVHVQPHPSIERKGRDLYMNLPVSVTEAIRGAKVSVPLPDGGSVTLRVPKRSQNGQKLRLRGKGVPGPKGGARGDLYVVLELRVPTAKDADLDKLASQMEAFYGSEVDRPTRL